MNRYECIDCGHEGPAREFRVFNTSTFVEGVGYVQRAQRHCPSCGSFLIEGRDDLIPTPGCQQGAPA